MSLVVRALAALALGLLAQAMAPAAPVSAALPAGDHKGSGPAPGWGWETVFLDGFDGAAGTAPEQWNTMLGMNGATQNGSGQLDVGQAAQIRTNVGWSLPPGTQVRVTASLLMPDTSANYAAFWVQHPNGDDPRELDVIESYGPFKSTGAQLGSHICYDDTPETAVNACVATGRGPELWPVTHAFPAGAEPWNAYWAYSGEFTIGGDSVLFSASDAEGNRIYESGLLPDVRRVPSNTVPFHLRLSNKDVLPENVVLGGVRRDMLVDWVRVDVKYP
ncbi:hypothetical protein [Nocardioides hwasunensis]|uniref:GH16 domain-containing protein n=1 Tax=Nocardioides hwasunensis TaxID=397258 RepID=A0ABR8MKY2_9ACTN|nr:hypothetical protein [Nocardioides hwasunensis]MBD3916652.1 hypothetical protein [Nocardioides hwasunensis]